MPVRAATADNSQKGGLSCMTESRAAVGWCPTSRAGRLYGSADEGWGAKNIARVSHLAVTASQAGGIALL